MNGQVHDKEWDELTPENFDTTALLRAVDAVDEMRSDLNDGEDGSPPQLRNDLLMLHQLAIHTRSRSVTRLLVLSLIIGDRIFCGSRLHPQLASSWHQRSSRH